MKNGRMIGTVLTVVNVALAAACVVLYLGTDREEPRFEFRAVDIIYQEKVGTSPLLEGITAYDNEDGDVTGGIVVEKLIENREGSSVVAFYAVSDKAGNVAKCSREFQAIFENADGSKGAESGMEVQEGWLMQSGFWTELEGSEGGSGSGIEGEGSDEGNEDGLEEDGLEEDDLEEDDLEEEAMPEGEGDSEGDFGEGEETGSAEGNNRENAKGREGGISRADEAEAGDAEAGDGILRADRDARADAVAQEDRAETVRETERQGAEGNGRDTDADSHGTPDGEAPVLTLQVSEVRTSVGVKPAWVEVIGSLSDDKDGYETLFRNLDVSKYDVNQPGTYQVTVSTRDSDGNKSRAVPLTIVVK